MEDGEEDFGKRLAALERSVATKQDIDDLRRELRAFLGQLNEQVEDLSFLNRMTVKQHAVLQMLHQGWKNVDIARVLGITESGAKVHVRQLAKTLGVTSRTQIVTRTMAMLDQVSDPAYLAASQGLPRTWARDHAGTPDDPYSWMVKRENGGEDDER